MLCGVRGVRGRMINNYFRNHLVQLFFLFSCVSVPKIDLSHLCFIVKKMKQNRIKLLPLFSYKKETPCSFHYNRSGIKMQKSNSSSSSSSKSKPLVNDIEFSHKVQQNSLIWCVRSPQFSHTFDMPTVSLF